MNWKFEANGHNYDCLWTIIIWIIQTINKLYGLLTICVNLSRIVMNYVGLWWLVTACDDFWPLLTTLAFDHLWPLTMNCDNLKQLVTTCDSMWQLVTTCDNLWQLVMTCDNLWHLWQLVPICQIGKINKILNELQILEKCDRQTDRRQKTEWVTMPVLERHAPLKIHMWVGTLTLLALPKLFLFGRG